MTSLLFPNIRQAMARGFRPRIGIVVVAVVSVSTLTSRPVLAQSSKDSHWGLGASFTPTWTSRDDFREKIFSLEGEGSVEGTAFTIGVVRGSTAGGDWGVSFVKKPIKDGSGSVLTQKDQFCANACTTTTTTETRATQSAFLQGVEFHWSKPFVTIKKRAQIGLNVGGGVAMPKGNILETQEFLQSPPPFRPTLPPGVPNFNECTLFSQISPGGTCRLTPDGYVLTETRPAKDVMLPYIPLITLEVEGAVILAPGLKIKIAGGFNAPSDRSVRVSAVYLIGAR
ncbi:MAG: hypothetical protein ABL961_04715 [Vicinamibacterales bacterium]